MKLSIKALFRDAYHRPNFNELSPLSANKVEGVTFQDLHNRQQETPKCLLKTKINGSLKVEFQRLTDGKRK